MKKVLIYLSLIVLSVSCLTNRVVADSGTHEYTVYYDGNEIQYDDASASIDDILSSLEPGDDVSINVTLRNDSDKSIEWYMKNNSENFSGGNGELEGLFTYRLTYSGSSNMTLYNSDSVGGKNGDGIQEATEDLKEYFELEVQKPGGSGVVTMYLALEGDTLDNSYEITKAKLTAMFEVEELPDPENKEEHTSRVVYIPYTGDTINLNFYIVMEMIALLLLAIVVFAYYVYSRRQEKSR